MHRRRLPILDPCSADWSEMRSVDDATRHCEQCQLEVHDLGAMTQAQALALLHGGIGSRVCVRYQCEPDGRIRFADTEVSSSSRWSALAAVASLLAWVGCASHEPPSLAVEELEPSVTQWLERSVAIPLHPAEVEPEPEEPISQLVVPALVVEQSVREIPGGIMMGIPVMIMRDRPSTSRDLSLLAGVASSTQVVGATSVVPEVDQLIATRREAKAERRKQRRLARQARRR